MFTQGDLSQLSEVKHFIIAILLLFLVGALFGALLGIAIFAYLT